VGLRHSWPVNLSDCFGNQPKNYDTAGETTPSWCVLSADKLRANLAQLSFSVNSEHAVATQAARLGHPLKIFSPAVWRRKGSQ
jgi:hypothetical protein